MKIKVQVQSRTNRIHIDLDGENGHSELLLTPKDFGSLRKAINRMPKRKSLVPKTLTKHMATDMVWRGDTYGASWKLRKAIVSLAMPDLAEALNRKV